MAKLTLTDVSAGYLSVATYNANNVLLEAALENTLSRDGTSPNTMSANLDLNSNKAVNLTDGTNAQDAVTKAQLDASVATPEGTAVKSTGVTDGYVLTADGANASAWEAIPVQVHEGTAIISTGVTDGYVLTADGADAAAWEAIPAPAGTAVTAVGVTDGYVLTADGANAAAWEAVPSGGAPEGTSVLSTGPVTDGYVLTADGAGAAAWEAATGGLSDVVSDLTPQLGGDLDLNTSDITGTGNLTHTGNITTTGNIDTLVGDIEASNTIGKMTVVQSGGSADYKKWSVGYATGNQLYFPRLLSDADVAGGYGFRFSRVGTATGEATFGGTYLSMSDKYIIATELRDYSVSKQSETSATATITTSYADGQALEITLTESITTWTWSNLPASDRYGEVVIKFIQHASGAYTVAWGGMGTVLWPGGTAPVMPTGNAEVMIVSLKTWDGGTTWYGDASLDYS